MKNIKGMLNWILIVAILFSFSACNVEKTNLGSTGSIDSEAYSQKSDSELVSSNVDESSSKTEKSESSKTEPVEEVVYLPAKIDDSIDEVVDVTSIPENLKKEMRMLYTNGYINTIKFDIYNKKTNERRTVSFFSANDADTNYVLNDDEYIGGYVFCIYTMDSEEVVEAYYKSIDPDKFIKSNGMAEYAIEFSNEFGFGADFISAEKQGTDPNSLSEMDIYMNSIGYTTVIEAGCEFIPNN
ncbi:MAG: hypothetical protein WC900_01275 [Oscillospiraceae bacterium]